MIRNECYKLFGNRKLLLGLLGILILNALYFWYCSRNDSFSSNGYKKLTEDVKDLGEGEALEYLNTEKRNAMLTMMGDEDSLHTVERSYPKYEKNLLQEMNLYQSLAMEYENVIGYPDYIRGILAESEKLTLMQSLFGADGREMKNVKKTCEDYSQLTGVTLHYGRTRGISSALALPSMLFLSVFFAVLIPMLLFTMEKEQNTLPLYASMEYGRGRLYFAKVIASLIGILIVNLLLYGSTIFAGCLLYGFPEKQLLTKPVQTLVGYQQTALPVSVGQFLILAYLWAVMVSVFFTLLTVFLSVMFSSSMGVYAVLSLLVGIEGVLYLKIDALDYRSAWKRMNLVALADAPKCLGQYRNEYLFGTPVSHLLLLLIVTLGAIIVLFSCTYRILDSGYGFAPRHAERRLVTRRKGRFANFSGHHTNIFLHELTKYFRFNKIGMVIVVLAVGSLLLLRPYQQSFTSLEERYYVAYLMRLDKVSSAEYDTLAGEFRAALEDERLQHGGGPSFAKKEAALVNIEEYIAYLHTKPGAVAVDSRGYSLMYTDLKMNVILGCIAMILAILCGVAMYYSELASGMDDMIRVSYTGRGRVLIRKIVWLVCALLVCFLLIYVRYFFAVTSAYGTPHFLEQANSIRDFAKVSRGQSIRDRIILLGIRRFVGMLIASIVAFLAVMRTRSFIIAVAIGIGILILPLLLCLTGYGFTASWVLNWFFV